MLNLKKLVKPAPDENNNNPKTEPQPDAAPLPGDLRDALQAALGREVPERLTKKEAELLAREVATKAPSLQRDLIDWMVGEYARKVRSKPAPKTARPPGFLGFFYVRDREGNWVPSRMRLLMAGVVLGLTFTLFLMGLMSGTGRQAASPAVAPAPAAAAAPSPGPALPAGEDAGAPVPLSPPLSLPSPPVPSPEGAASASPEGAGVPNPPLLLPPPPADLPPPPDYEGPGLLTPGGQGVVALEERPGVQMPGQGDGGGLTTSFRRPVEQAAFGGRGNAASAQAPEQGIGFWQRGSGDQQDPPSDPFWRREEGEGWGVQTEAFWRRGGNGGVGGEGEGLALAPPHEASSERTIEVVYRRGSPSEPGGVIPPGGGAGFPPGQPSSPPSTPQPGAPGAGTP